MGLPNMLYLVGTPIGNLDDLSLRQAKIISQTEIILTEDTRSTGILLQRISELFGLQKKANQRLISYYKEKEFEKLPEIMDLLQSDRDIVLISEAGMPLISDPGYLLVNQAIKKQIPFTVIPGPTAAFTALVYSGFKPEEAMFIGFLPKKNSDIKKIWERLLSVKKVMPEAKFIFYESPQRIQDTLRSLATVWPDANVCVCRELTKKFEEIVRGKPAELATREYRGEISVVIA